MKKDILQLYQLNFYLPELITIFVTNQAVICIF